MQNKINLKKLHPATDKYLKKYDKVAEKIIKARFNGNHVNNCCGSIIKKKQKT